MNVVYRPKVLAFLITTAILACFGLGVVIVIEALDRLAQVSINPAICAVDPDYCIFSTPVIIGTVLIVTGMFLLLTSKKVMEAGRREWQKWQRWQGK